MANCLVSQSLVCGGVTTEVMAMMMMMMIMMMFTKLPPGEGHKVTRALVRSGSSELYLIQVSNSLKRNFLNTHS